MADGVSLAGLNPIGKIGGGGGNFGMILLVFVIAIVILALVGFFLYMNYTKKQFFLTIRVFRNIGNVPTEINVFKAREIAFGMAGDKLWKVAPNSAMGMMTKVIKWLPVGKFQTKPNEFWYWIREDGEWINFRLQDLDAQSLKMGAKFVQEDMRLQRLATDKLLEQRLMNKGFWDKWGNTIMTVIFFLVIAVCMVIIFYQFSKIIDKLSPLIEGLIKSNQQIAQYCIQNITASGGGSALIPVA
jgi:uncharacterized membrane protein